MRRKVTRPPQTKYIGFSFRKGKNKWKPKLYLKSYRKIKRKLNELTKRSWNISLDNNIKKINQLKIGWINYFKVANIKNVIQ